MSPQIDSSKKDNSEKNNSGNKPVGWKKAPKKNAAKSPYLKFRKKVIANKTHPRTATHNHEPLTRVANRPR